MTWYDVLLQKIWGIWYYNAWGYIMIYLMIVNDKPQQTWTLTWIARVWETVVFHVMGWTTKYSKAPIVNHQSLHDIAKKAGNNCIFVLIILRLTYYNPLYPQSVCPSPAIFSLRRSPPAPRQPATALAATAPQPMANTAQGQTVLGGVETSKQWRV